MIALTTCELQLRTKASFPLRTRRDYRRAARWWELEAMRGYDSAPRSRAYAATMRWAAELTRIYGDGLFSELLAKAGVNAPEYADGGFK